MDQDTRDRILDKLANAHSAMLSTVGVVLGIIVSATSILASVGGHKSVLLFPIIVVSFIGVACVLASFYEAKKELFAVMELAEEIVKLSPVEQANKLNDFFGRHSPANRLSYTALLVTAIAAGLFLLLCAQIFVPQLS